MIDVSLPLSPPGSRTTHRTTTTHFPLQVVSAPDLRAGLSSILQLTGLGGLRPNTCVLAWPDARRLSHERALRFLEFIARAAVNEKAVLALKTWGPRFLPFPASDHVLRGHPLDVWWLLHDGGVLILVAYLLKRHATWRHCSLRIFTVVQASWRYLLVAHAHTHTHMHKHAGRPFLCFIGLIERDAHKQHTTRSRAGSGRRSRRNWN